MYRFCIISRLEDSQKNISAFLKEIHKVRVHEGSNFIVDIFGEGNDLNYYKNMLKILDLENTVNFKGFQRITSQLLEKYDCLIITSKYESGPLTLLEAVSSNLPVVSTRVGYSLRVLPENCLFEFGKKQLEVALNYAISNRQVVLEFSTRNISKVVNLDILEFIDDWRKILDQEL